MDTKFYDADPVETISKHGIAPQLKNHDNLLVVYPNPAQEYLKLQFSTPVKFPLTIELYDVLGKIVAVEKLQSQESKINISTLANGFYTLNCTINGKRISKKIIVNK